MPKAQYVTSSGARVTIEGTTEEVASVLHKLEAGTGRPEKTHTTRPAKTNKTQRGAVGHVLALRESGYFRTPRKLAEVKDALGKDGHLVPSTPLAVILLRLVRRKELQRTRDGGSWKYGNR